METGKKLYGRPETAQTLNISLRKLDELLATRQIASLRIGKRRLISDAAIASFIRRAEQAAR